MTTGKVRMGWPRFNGMNPCSKVSSRNGGARGPEHPELAAIVGFLRARITDFDSNSFYKSYDRIKSEHGTRGFTVERILRRFEAIEWSETDKISSEQWRTSGQDRSFQIKFIEYLLGERGASRRVNFSTGDPIEEQAAQKEFEIDIDEIEKEEFNVEISIRMLEIRRPLYLLPKK